MITYQIYEQGGSIRQIAGSYGAWTVDKTRETRSWWWRNFRSRYDLTISITETIRFNSSRRHAISACLALVCSKSASVSARRPRRFSTADANSFSERWSRRGGIWPPGETDRWRPLHMTENGDNDLDWDEEEWDLGMDWKAWDCAATFSRDHIYRWLNDVAQPLKRLLLCPN